MSNDHVLPVCMMRDGADPCEAYKRLRAEIERLRTAAIYWQDRCGELELSQSVPENYCNAYELLGWAHAEFCGMLDRGEDPRRVEVPKIVPRMEKAMLAAAPQQEDSRDE